MIPMKNKFIEKNLANFTKLSKYQKDKYLAIL